jgi:hypothetical protein
MLLEYSAYAKVALEKNLRVLAKHSLNNSAINLTLDSVLPY